VLACPVACKLPTSSSCLLPLWILPLHNLDAIDRYPLGREPELGELAFTLKCRAWAREEREDPLEDDDETERRRELETEDSGTTPASGDGMASEGDVERERARRRVREM
jgi:hypothetical protein